MRAFEQGVTAVERALLMLSGATLVAIMMIVVIDVALRYTFASPLSWSFDLISLYLSSLVFFFALSDTFRAGAHIKVDFFGEFRSIRLRAATEIIGILLVTVFFWVVFAESVSEGWDALAARDVVAGAIPWPTWISQAVAAMGVGLLILRLILRVCIRLLELWDGTDRTKSHAAPEEMAR